jgi:carbonic anhydrase
MNLLAACVLSCASAPPCAPAAAAASSPPPAAVEHGGEHHGPIYAEGESNGAAQSPIDLVTSEAQPGKHSVKTTYVASREHLTNTGHTLKASYDPGSSIELDGKTYDLQQFHFHTPAEHLLDGATYPLELHMVHGLRGEEGRYLVVGVLFKEGAADALLGKLVAAAPPESGGTKDDDSVSIDVKPLFNPTGGYFHYAGSLTTPPFAETVSWIVSRQVREASHAQIAAINRLEGNNARHVQVLGARHVDVN